MKLPNRDNALVEERKVVFYLLADEHSGGKAAFFAAFGYTMARWEVLRDALLQHAAVHDVVRMSQTVHGVKYIIEGELVTPDNRSPQVRSVWIIDAASEIPRLVTAYPLERDSQ